MARGHHPAHRASALCRYSSALFCILALVNCCRAALVTIDDFSPRVQYNTPVLEDTICKFQRGNGACDGHWWFEHDDSRGSYENHTVHTTYGPGTTATLEFTGTSVALYGIVLQQYGAHAVATLDGTRSSFDCNTSSLPDGALLTKQQLFSKSGLDPSVPHKLVVAYDDATFDEANRAWLSIDYFEIDEQLLPVVVSQTSVRITSTRPILTRTLPVSVTSDESAATATPSSDSLAPVTPSSDSLAPVTSSSHSLAPVTSDTSPNVGAIVGGVIGGFALALAAISTALLIRRKRLHRQQQQREHDSALLGADASSTRRRLFATPSDPTTTPYIVPPAWEFPTATSYAPSSFSGADDLLLVPPPYTPGDGTGMAEMITPSDANAARKR